MEQWARGVGAAVPDWALLGGVALVAVAVTLWRTLRVRREPAPVVASAPVEAERPGAVKPGA